MADSQYSSATTNAIQICEKTNKIVFIDDYISPSPFSYITINHKLASAEHWIPSIGDEPYKKFDLFLSHQKEFLPHVIGYLLIKNTIFFVYEPLIEVKIESFSLFKILKFLFHIAKSLEIANNDNIFHGSIHLRDILVCSTENIKNHTLN